MLDGSPEDEVLVAGSSSSTMHANRLIRRGCINSILVNEEIIPYNWCTILFAAGGLRPKWLIHMKTALAEYVPLGPPAPGFLLLNTLPLKVHSTSEEMSVLDVHQFSLSVHASSIATLFFSWPVRMFIYVIWFISHRQERLLVTNSKISEVETRHVERTLFLNNMSVLRKSKEWSYNTLYNLEHIDSNNPCVKGILAINQNKPTMRTASWPMVTIHVHIGVIMSFESFAIHVFATPAGVCSWCTHACVFYDQILIRVSPIEGRVTIQVGISLVLLHTCGSNDELNCMGAYISSIYGENTELIGL